MAAVPVAEALVVAVGNVAARSSSAGEAVDPADNVTVGNVAGAARVAGVTT